jgi:hypothetical protein
MGKGDRPKVRKRNDRERAKRARGKRKALAKGQARRAAARKS